jgi:hypothetical protein
VDVQKFKAMIEREGKQGLLNVLANVRAKKHAEYEDLVLAQLDSRFPGWSNAKKGRSGGRTYNRATFLGEAREFQTAKEGYLWLAENFISKVPDVFANPDGRTARIAIGHGRNYFARSPEKLFGKSPHLADNSANYSKLSNGWFANVNLSNANKFEVLVRLSYAANMAYGEAWEWVVPDSTDPLAKGQKAHKLAIDILKALDMELNEVNRGDRAQ